MSYPKSRLGKLFIKKADLLRELDAVLHAVEGGLVTTSSDGSIVNNAGDVKVGVLATDTQHGSHGGGALHAVATTTVAGFESAADKAKLDGLSAVISTFAAVRLLNGSASTIEVSGKTTFHDGFQGSFDRQPVGSYVDDDTNTLVAGSYAYIRRVSVGSISVTLYDTTQGSASNLKVPAGATLVNGVLDLTDLTDSSIPGLTSLLSHQPRRLLMPLTRPGRTHLIDTGVAIKQWSDLSGFGLHAVQVTAARMASLALVGADLVASFVAANTNWLQGPSPLTTAQAAWTRVIAFSADVNTALLQAVINTITPANVLSIQVNVSGGAGKTDMFCDGNSGQEFTNVANINNLHVWVQVFDGSLTGTARFKLYLDGATTPFAGAPFNTPGTTLPICDVDVIGTYYSNHTSFPLNGGLALLADFPQAVSGASLTALNSAIAEALQVL